MIYISPLAEYASVLTNLDKYKLAIKGVQISVEQPKTVSTSTTIDGGSQIAIFKKSIAGLEQTIKTRLNDAELAILRNIAYSAVNEWLLVHNNRRFVVCVTLTSAVRKEHSVHNVVANVTFIRELKR